MHEQLPAIRNTFRLFDNGGKPRSHEPETGLDGLHLAPLLVHNTDLPSFVVVEHREIDRHPHVSVFKLLLGPHIHEWQAGSKGEDVVDGTRHNPKVRTASLASWTPVQEKSRSQRWWSPRAGRHRPRTRRRGMPRRTRVETTGERRRWNNLALYS